MTPPHISIAFLALRYKKLCHGFVTKLSLTYEGNRLIVSIVSDIFYLEVMPMDKMCASINMNLKTGFFRTEPYVLQVFRESLKLIPASNDKINEIVIACMDVKGVTISTGVSGEVEIRTNQATWIGAFPKMVDVSEIIGAFKMVLGKRFLYM